MPTENQLLQEEVQAEVHNKHSDFVPGNDSQIGSMMPESPVLSPVSASFDFDSDDSVRDKDYLPSDSSEGSDEDEATTTSKEKRLKENNISATTSAIPSTSHSSQPPLRIVKKKVLTKKRRITTDFSEVSCISSEKHARKRRNTYDGGEEGRNHISNCATVIEETAHQETDDVDNRNPPKRRRYDTSLAQRKKEKKGKKRKEYYAVKTGCNEKCLKKCSTHFNNEDRENLNEAYWKLTWEQRRLYVQSRIAVAVPKRKYTSEPKRKPRRSFRLTARDGGSVEVCKHFFLTTLGYNKNNDKVLRIDFQTTGEEHDKRGKHQKTPLFDRKLLTEHVKSFQPEAPHYRREHAPLRRYLPSDINITMMHKDFCEKHLDQKVSYELYRKHLKDMKISFTQLGNEECEDCKAYKLHKQQTSHDVTAQLVAECSTCVEFAKHHERYTKVRQFYAYHKTLPQDEKKIFFSADLEKIIMLPRMDTFKKVIFAQRLVVFNQTFAPVGKITTQSKPVTVI